MQNLPDPTWHPKELAKQGYIKFDIETGIAENGNTICLISDEEKFILQTIRKTFGGSLPENYNLEIKINELKPLVFNFRK